MRFNKDKTDNIEIAGVCKIEHKKERLLYQCDKTEDKKIIEHKRDCR